MRYATAALAILVTHVPALAQEPTSVWLGRDFWANRLQDWSREGDALVCRAPDLPLRTVHWLTRALEPVEGSAIEVSVHCRIDAESDDAAHPTIGFWLGVGADDLDHRAAALAQAAPGPDGGVLAGIDAHGQAFVRDMSQPDADEALPPPPELLPRDSWIATGGAASGRAPENVLDGDPTTAWRAAPDAAPTAENHELVIDMQIGHTIGGLYYVPRQDGRAGRVQRFELHARDSIEEDWGQPIATGTLSAGRLPKTVRFVPITARYLRFVALSTHDGRTSAAIAELAVLPPGAEAPRIPTEVVLTAHINGVHDGVGRVEIIATTRDDGRELSRASRDDVPLPALRGAIALACGGGSPGSTRFTSWRAGGDGVVKHEDRAFGPIAGTQYTLSQGTLRLTAQLMPIDPALLTESVRLEIREGDSWSEVARSGLTTPGWTATFEIDDWRAAQDRPYRIACTLADGAEHSFEGTVRREPDGRRPLVLAGFTGNHNVRFGFGRRGFPWNRDGLWFPHDDLVAHVRALDPDLLFFSGDQIYEGASPTPADRRGDGVAELDYLYKWLLWIWAFRDLTRDRPTVTLPDDHDVYQGNLWGAGGRPASRDHDGGYVMPAEWVRMVERTQCSHLPRPSDPAPIEQGIEVNFGRLVYGGVDFAILEDRKFKSGPAGLVPPTASGRPDHVVDPEFDPSTADVDGARLLGERQMRFLADWAADWSGGAQIKATLSGTVFAGLATHHGPELKRLVADYDCNGWPQGRRDAALAEIRKGFGFLIGGDQHLSTLAHLGIDTWRDAGWSFAVPSIANFYPRAWHPTEPGANRSEGQAECLGDHLDGFGNPVTVWAVTNPDTPTGREPAALHDRMPGFGVVRFDTRARTITVECWPRGIDPNDSGASQYPGWPQTIHQLDNDGRTPAAWLPELRVVGLGSLPVVEIRSADGELVWAWRAKRSVIRPWVFAPGTYRVRIGDPDDDRWQELELETASGSAKTESIDVAF